MQAVDELRLKGSGTADAHFHFPEWVLCQCSAKQEKTLAGSSLLAGKVAVITGGASGIGRACAFAIAEEGAAIAIFDSKAKESEETAEVLRAAGRTVASYVLDVREEASIREAVEQTIARFGQIDILFNNAGIAMRQPVAEQDEQGWDSCMDVNLKGVFLCSKHVLPHMFERGGSVINNSSVTGVTGVRNRAVYSATKAAIVGLTKNMALDYASHGIRVNCVCPGFTRTPLIAALLRDPVRTQKLIDMHPLGRLGEAEDIANAVVFLASDRASWITGQALVVDGGFSAGRPDDV